MSRVDTSLPHRNPYTSLMTALLALSSSHDNSRSDGRGVLEKPLRPGRNYKAKIRARQSRDMRRSKR